MVKNMPANAGDMGSIPGWRRSSGGGNANHSSILAWKIPWTEETARLQSMGSQRVGHDSEGDQPWDFFGRNDAKAEAPVLWTPHVKR